MYLEEFASHFTDGTHQQSRKTYDFYHIFQLTPSGIVLYMPLFSGSKNNGLVTQPLTPRHQRVNARETGRRVSGPPRITARPPGIKISLQQSRTIGTEMVHFLTTFLAQTVNINHMSHIDHKSNAT